MKAQQSIFITRTIQQNMKLVALVIFALAAALVHATTTPTSGTCVYNLEVKTGDLGNDGTVDLTLRDKYGNSITFNDLDTTIDNFMPWSTDTFRLTGNCLRGPVCSATVAFQGVNATETWSLNALEGVVTNGCYRDENYFFFDFGQVLGNGATRVVNCCR